MCLVPCYTELFPYSLVGISDSKEANKNNYKWSPIMIMVLKIKIWWDEKEKVGLPTSEWEIHEDLPGGVAFKLWPESRAGVGERSCRHKEEHMWRRWLRKELEASQNRSRLSLGMLSRWWQKAEAEMQMETCKCSVKHLLVSPLLTSHWIKQVTWLDAERVGGHQRSWQSTWLKEGVRYLSHRCDRSTTPALFFFCFLVKEESSSH